MGLDLITAPTVEPVTVGELKNHLRLASTDFIDDVASTQSHAPDTWAIGTHNGTGVDVLLKQAICVLNVGTVAATTTLDVKLQDSDDDVAYTDVTGGSFAQVTVANDNTTYELAYSGIKQYIRAVAVVANDTADFTTTIVTSEPTSAEDTLLTDWIIAAREEVESYLNRALITQTWELVLDDWPKDDYIEIPLPPLQSITSVKYYDTDDTVATFSDSNYFVDSQNEPGRVVLNYSETWPTTTLRPANAVIVKFIAGYGDARTAVPYSIRQAVKLIASDMYENREQTQMKKMYDLPMGIHRLLMKERFDFV